MPRPSGPQHQRDLLRQGVVLASTLFAIIGSFIGSGAAGGTPIQNAAGGALAADATLIAPAGSAFAIWNVIYIGLLAYAVWQSLAKQKDSPRQRLLGYPIAASLVLNGAWILSIQFGALLLSVVLIILLLCVLVWAFFRCLRTTPTSLLEALIADGTVGLYLGWVCVATAANITAWLVAIGVGGGTSTSSPTSDLWAVVIISGAGTIGVLLAIAGHGRLAPSLSLSWGLGWLASARLTGDLRSSPAAIAAIIAVVVVMVVTVALRMTVGRGIRTTHESAHTESQKQPV